jgi:hypothetical protein
MHMKHSWIWTLTVVALLFTGSVNVCVEEPTKLGEGVTLQQATPIADLVSRPADFVGKKVRVDGTVDAVCQNMHCWMDLKDAEGRSVRFKVEDGVIVFPVSAKGKRASAEGTFEKVDAAADAAHHAEHADGKEADHDHGTPASYRVKATGALVY